MTNKASSSNVFPISGPLNPKSIISFAVIDKSFLVNIGLLDKYSLAVFSILSIVLYFII